MSTDTNYDTHLISAFSMYKNAGAQNPKVKKKRKQIPVENVQKVSKKPKIVSKNIEQNEDAKKVIKKNGSKLASKKEHCIGPINTEKNLGFHETSLEKNLKQNGNAFALSDDPLADAHQLLKWLLDPVSPNMFFEHYWEQKALHIKRAKKDGYAHILNSAALDKIIRNNNLYYTRNVDVVSYENGVKEVHNPEGKVVPSVLWDYYSNGCSIRVLNPQTYSHKVHLLLATLQENFGSMVGANVYLTPRNSQGFAPHYDDIEAFILQLEGRKHWKLYQPKGADVLARFSSLNLKHEHIGQPFMELTLNAGEVLYFPRGTIHEGYTDADSHSLHITISVYQQTSYTDLLEHILPHALKKASENDINFRRGLPLDYLKHFGAAAFCGKSKLRNVVQNKIGNLIQSLMQHVDIDSAADLLGKKLMYDSMPPVLSKDETMRCSKADGTFLQNGEVCNKVEINLNTKVRLLRYYCIRLVNENNTSLKLYYNTENANVYHGEEEQWLELESNMLQAIQTLQNAYPRYVEVDHLPMDDENLKLQLISDLWERGLVITEYHLKSVESN